jgi:hypothetical protein
MVTTQGMCKSARHSTDFIALRKYFAEVAAQCSDYRDKKTSLGWFFSDSETSE